MASDIRRDRSAVAAHEGMRRISWGAVIAGSLLAVSIQFTLGLLGLGIGLATLETARNGEAGVSAFASTSGLWTVAVVLIGLFLGAYAAGRLAGSPSRTDAFLHGAVTWATSTLFVIVLLTSGASIVIGGAFGAVGGTIQSLSQAAAAVTPDSLPPMPDTLRREVETLLSGGRGASAVAGTAADTQAAPSEAAPNDAAAPAAGAPASGQTLAEATATIVRALGESATAEQRQAAVQVMAQHGGLSQQEASQRLQSFQQQYDKVLQEARQAAARAAGAVSTASFGAFVALLLGLVVGSLGGLLGRPRRHTV